jgi:hypothetical protein
LVFCKDITSYLIARTLGIVDDVKASTSDKKTIHNLKEGLPSIVLQDTSADTTPPSDSVPTPPATNTVKLPSQTDIDHPQLPPQTYFASEDTQLRLSGEGVFSPAVSQPSSPTITRRRLRDELNDAD